MEILQNNIFICLASLIVAYFSVNWVYFKVLFIAKDKNLVDNPDARKLQKTPIPVMGGIAVFFGVIAGLFMGCSIIGLSVELAHMGSAIEIVKIIPIFFGMGIMLYTGAMDDILGLTPRSRIVIEFLSILGLILISGMCIDSFHGLFGIHTFNWYVAIPLTIVAGIGIINAMNMIDGVNGLSSGLCITCSLFYGIIFIDNGDTANAILAFTVVGAIIPFFIHNVFGLKSRMFIGDAGTMVIGLLLGWFTVCILSGRNSNEISVCSNIVSDVALVLAVLSVPVADTLRVMTLRMLKGQSPFHPDKTHLHHAFVIVGFSHSVTALSEILIDITVVLVLVLVTGMGASQELQLAIVIIVSAILVWGTYGFLKYHAKRHTMTLHRLTKISVKTHMGRKEWWKALTQILDAPEDELIEKRKKVENTAQPHLQRKFSHPGPQRENEKDFKCILDFMKGKAEVYVYDILNNSGATEALVYPIIQEAAEAGTIRIIKRDDVGNPEIVALEQ